MKKSALFVLILSLSALASGQTNGKRNIKPTNQTPAATPLSAPENSQLPEKTPQKKNARQGAPANSPESGDSKIEESKILYRFEFAQPNFLIKKVVIEHDETGKGKITFEEKNFVEPVTDKLQLSPVSLEKIQNLFKTLNFLDSTENYQSTVHNYPHLGTKKIRLKDNSKERAIEFNWTENADAKALGEEYSKIAYQLVWQSDIKVARENQPLETPGLIDVLDSYLKRGEISDPVQLLPFLKELSNDERLPLLARNHVSRLIKEIEKKKQITI